MPIRLVFMFNENICIIRTHNLSQYITENEDGSHIFLFFNCLVHVHYYFTEYKYIEGKYIAFILV